MPIILLVRIIIAFVLTLAVAATPTYAAKIADQHFEAAQQHYLAGELEAAQTQLKSALLSNRTHLGSLLLLGKIYLGAGNAAAAGDMLINALKQGAEPAPNTLLAAEAFLQQGDFSAVINKLSLSDDTSLAAAELMGFQALAYFNTSEQKRGTEVLQRALTGHPNSLMPQIALTWDLLQTQQLDDALALAPTIVEQYPESARAWGNFGLVAHANEDYETASNAYGRAIELDPHLLHARINRARLLVRGNKNDVALRELEYYKQHDPDEPRAAFLRGILLERAGKKTQAMAQFRTATFVLSTMNEQEIANNGQLTTDAALAHIHLGEIESARAYLEAYQIQNSVNAPVNQLLASLLLQLKEAAVALTLIEPLLKKTPNVAELLSLQAEAYKQLGQYGKAAAIQLRVSSLETGSGNHTDAGTQTIAPPQMATYNQALSSLILEDYPRAATLAASLVHSYPSNSHYLTLLGTAQLQSGDNDQAYQTLMNAASSDNADVNLQLSLARFESAQGNHKLAKERLQSLSVAESSRQNISESAVLFHSSRAEYASGNIDKSIALAERALKKSPPWLELRIYLAQLYLDSMMDEKAVSLIKKAAASDQKNIAIQFVLGEVLERTDQLDRAYVHYKNMKRKSLFDTAALGQLAVAFIRLDAWVDADNTLYRALQLSPTHLPTLLTRVSVLNHLQRGDTALDEAIQLVADQPTAAAAYLYRAAALRALGHVAEAEKDQQKASKLEPENDLYLLAAFQNLLQNGMQRAAENLLSAALSEPRESPLLVFAYATFLTQNQRWQDATTLLKSSINDWPNNPLLLNNMAIVLHQQDRAEAITYAREAYALGPQIPQINDTLGWIVAAQEGPQAALPYLQEAVKLQPQAPELHYHLGATYFNLGRMGDSRRHLQQALSAAGNYPGRMDAARLFQSLPGSDGHSELH